MSRHGSSRKVPRPTAGRARRCCAAAALAVAVVSAWTIGSRADGDVICSGDCNFDRSTTVDELIKGVNIVLGSLPADTCRSFDLTADGTVSIAELVGAVRNALSGCPSARFEQQACTTTPTSRGPQWALCGTLIVPEDRSAHDGRTLRLAALVLPASVSDAAPAEAKDDLIFLERRGSGRSRPAPTCGERDDPAPRALALEQETDALTAELWTCHDRLAGDGGRIDADWGTALAADVGDLASVLGYQQYTLYGLSYGARIALVATREAAQHRAGGAPGSIRPVQGTDLTSFAATERSLQLVFATCASEPWCNAAYFNRRGFLGALHRAGSVRYRSDGVRAAFYRPAVGANG